jgi:hypothetical protein
MSSQTGMRDPKNEKDDKDLERRKQATVNQAGKDKAKGNKATDFPEKTGTTTHQFDVSESTGSSGRIDNPREQNLNQ